MMKNKTLKILIPLVSIVFTIASEGAAQANDHGERTLIGNVEVLDKSFEVALFGGIEPDKQAAFEVVPTASIAGLNTFLWVESRDGKRLSAPASAIVEGNKLHFHTVPREKPYQVVLRVRGNGTDERGVLVLPAVTATDSAHHGEPESGQHGHHDHGDGHGHSH